MAKFGKRRKREMGLLEPLVPKATHEPITSNLIDVTQDRSRLNDLRFRPFLVVEIHLQPSDQVSTSVAGWKTIKNSMKALESHVMVDRIAKRHLMRAEVIIDVVNDCLIKNRFDNIEEDPAMFNLKVMDHYKKKYSSDIERGKAVWKRQEASAARLSGRLLDPSPLV